MHPLVLAVSVGLRIILSTLLDHFGLLGTSPRHVDLSRTLGIAVLLLGTWLMVH